MYRLEITEKDDTLCNIISGKLGIEPEVQTISETVWYGDKFEMYQLPHNVEMSLIIDGSPYLSKKDWKKQVQKLQDDVTTQSLHETVDAVVSLSPIQRYRLSEAI